MNRAERWIYRDMIEVYYDTEKPLPLDVDGLCHVIGARTEDDRKIVAELLRYKFQKTEDGFRNVRCDDEIAAYHAKAETAKANGRLGGRPSKPKTHPEKPSGFLSGSDPVAIGNPEQTGSQTNHEPVTKNHKPKTVSAQPGGAMKTAALPPAAKELNIVLRNVGIQIQPADSRVIALAEQGVTPETVGAACEEARRAKPNEQIGVGYVIKIIERWAAIAAEMKVSGAVPPKANGAWWATDELIIAKGVEMKMTPLPGEVMATFKGRIQCAIDNGGIAPVREMSRVSTTAPDRPKGIKPDGLNLKALLRPGPQVSA